MFASPPLLAHRVMPSLICLPSSTGPPRMSPKSQRTPRAHRVQPCRTAGVPSGVDLISHSAAGEAPVIPPTKSSSSGGTWSSVVSGGGIICSLCFLFISVNFRPCEYFYSTRLSICQVDNKLWFHTTGWHVLKGLCNISHFTTFSNTSEEAPQPKMAETQP